MKAARSALILPALFAQANAASVTLAWDPSTSTNLAGYRVYSGPASRVYPNSVFAGNVTMMAVSNLTINVSSFFSVTAVDSSGTESDFSNEIEYTPTNPPPAITLTSPPDGMFYATSAAISLTAGVATNGHTITKIQFYNGSTLLGEDSSAPYAFTWSHPSAGVHSLTARLVYDGGNTLSSAVDSVAVTNPPPTIALTSPTNGTSYMAPAVINLAAKVISNGHTIAKVQFYQGLVLLGEDKTTPYTFIWTNVSAANYGLTVRLVYDGSNTLSSAIDNVTVTNPPPTIALTSPTNGTNYDAPAAIPLAANVTPTGHAITKVQFYNGSTLLGEDSSAPYVLTWTNVNAGTYSLTARLVYDATTILDSPSATIQVNGLPAPWQVTDIGTLGVTGSAGASNGLYTLNGAGTLNGMADNFSFVNQPLSADGEIQVHLASTQNLTNSSALAGLMIRETLTTGSKYVFVGISDTANFLWQHRAVSGGKPSFIRPVGDTVPSPWLRLTRTGATLSGYQSTDGVNWTLVNSIGSFSIGLASEIYFGLVVSSGSSNQPGTATFTTVTAVP